MWTMCKMRKKSIASRGEKCIVAALVLHVLALLLAAQGVPRPADAKQERENQTRSDAIFLLKDILLRNNSIVDLRRQSDVVVDAASLIWEHDPQFANENLLIYIEKALSIYRELAATEKRTSDEDKRLRDLDYSLRESLKLLNQKNPNSGVAVQKEYSSIRENKLRLKNLGEELELAADGLDSDEERAVSLILAILRQRIPSEFSKLIFDLRLKRPAVADMLVPRAIEYLAVNPGYKASDAIYLSTVVFNESQRIIPVLNDPTAPNDFGVFTIPVEQVRTQPNRQHVLTYSRAVKAFFEARLLNQTDGFFESTQNLIQSYFLLEKLKAYSQAHDSIDPEVVDRLLLPTIASMQTAGFLPQTLAQVKGYAERLATSNNPLDLDDGTRAFEKADTAKTPEEKLNYLISGIIQKIESKQFAFAERKIFDVQNSEIRDALYMLLHTRAGLAAIEKKDWDEFEKRTERTTDKRIKAFMYLNALAALKSGKVSRNLLTDYVIKAEKNINDIADKTAKASAMVCLTSLMYSLEGTESLRDVSTAISRVNDAADYSETIFEIRIIIPTRPANYAQGIGANAFKDVFSKIAQTDWTNAQVQALQIKNPGLQAIAQIAAAKSVLAKLGPAKKAINN